VRHAGVFGARVSRINNEREIRARRGVLDVRLIEQGVAVVELSEGVSVGDVVTAFADASQTVSAEYFVPYLAHATLEPMNATVWREDGKLHVVCGVQNPLLARAHAAQVAGLELDDVVLEARPMGGGFGRRVAFSMTGDVPLNWLTDAVQSLPPDGAGAVRGGSRQHRRAGRLAQCEFPG